MKLSCVILICDKDYNYITDLVKSIDEKVKIKHEIIVIDNREKYKDKEVDFANATVYSKGYNLYQLESRRWAIELVTGDYVWFIDGDDSINEVPEMEVDTDILCFNFTTSIQEIFSCNYFEEEKIETNLLSGENYTKMLNVVWNKWIKVDVLKKVYKCIQKDMQVSSSEDMIIVVLSLKYAKSCKHINNVFYNFNCERSNSARLSYDNIKQFEAIIKGHNDAFAVIQSNLTETELAVLGLNDLYMGDCAYFLNKFRRCKPEIKNGCVELLLQYFSKKVLQEAALRYLFPTYCTFKEVVVLLSDIEGYYDPKQKLSQDVLDLIPDYLFSSE